MLSQTPAIGRRAEMNRVHAMKSMPLKQIITTAGLVAAGFFMTACTAVRAPRENAPHSGAVATGHYRNLFAEDGHAKKEIREKVDSAFAQLFYGGPNRAPLFCSAGANANGPLAYIFDGTDRDVRSEGMSYGMMIAVQLDKKPEFDALWNWAKTFMQHTDTNHPACGYFSWSLKTNGVANDDMPAPDGEEYFVTALFFASARWGDGAGIYNYRSEAVRLLSDLKNRAIITGLTVTVPKTCTALFSSTEKMVRFMPDAGNSEHSDASYHLPAFYELWSRLAAPADRAFWRDAATTSRDYFQRSANPVTGLCPEYGNFDGTPWAAPWKTNSVDFRYDSWRVAMNWAMDWSWWRADPREQVLSDRLLAFFETTKNFPRYGNQFALSGRQLSSNHSTGLVAMNAVAALAATDPRAKQFVEELWNAPVPLGRIVYYDAMLYLLGLLHCSGEFRVWMPR